MYTCVGRRITRTVQFYSVNYSRAPPVVFHYSVPGVLQVEMTRKYSREYLEYFDIKRVSIEYPQVPGILRPEATENFLIPGVLRSQTTVLSRVPRALLFETTEYLRVLGVLRSEMT